MSFGKPAAASGSSQLSANITTFEQNLSRFEANSQDATKWRDADRAVKTLDSLSATISANLRTAKDANASDLQQKFGALDQRYQSAKAAFAQKKEQANAPPPPPTGPDGKPLQQSELAQIEADASQLEFLQRETSDILESQRVIHDITAQVGDVIDRDHQKVVHIDETVEEAKQEMVQGNEELAQAEEHQKSCNIA
jgi:chromosome segregation ATPase